MEARRRNGWAGLLIVAALCSLGAGHRTRNFIVTADDAGFAKQVAEAAEAYRRDLAIAWLGRELPPWPQPCDLKVNFHRDAFGATSFAFDGPYGERGIPFGWTMEVNGSAERILDSVLPHEITHTVLATHFGRRLPRWLDEGASSTCEHVSETSKQEHNLIVFLTQGRGIPFNRMFRMMEYPHDQRDMLALYAQGLSVVRFLLQYDNRAAFLEFTRLGLESEDWDGAVRQVYGFRDLSDLQVTWNRWVADGSPGFTPESELLAKYAPGLRAEALASAIAVNSANSMVPDPRSNVAAVPVAAPAAPDSSSWAQQAASTNAVNSGAALTVSRPSEPLGEDLTDSWYYRRGQGNSPTPISPSYRPEAGRGGEGTDPRTLAAPIRVIGPPVPPGGTLLR